MTAARLRTYSLILLIAYALAIISWIVLSRGLLDINGKPLGTDFASFYAAGSLALDDRAVSVYDMTIHYARERQLFGTHAPYYAWFYPPFFLLIAAPLAAFSYLSALTVWQFVTFALYFAVICAILLTGPLKRSHTVLGLLATAAFPAVFINLGHGQNGFLTAALLGGALLVLPRRPILAGILFGLLAYKPQFGLVIPVVLLAAGQWRSIGAAAMTVAALILGTMAVFGPDIWTAFAASTELSRKMLLQDGDVGFEKLQSVFAAVRMWGGSVSLAYAVQGVLSAVVIGSVAQVWRSSRDNDIKAAALSVATALASPHVLDYDLMILGPAIAFMAVAIAKHGARRYEITALAAVWLAPLVTRGVSSATGIPLALIAMIVLYGIIQYRDRAARADSSRLDSGASNAML
ncbi:glycosyltransferase family 87 protein [Nitrobacter sp. Nb-311A]|uniref:glycosyltransferase family 87 protein n=1 Tax=Nitrobacter sp. Nb-311A TaxID=314253 RepID=UPI001A94C238|nr:glycosyltransferase family 87 protein [Nitrobacter sp. Nb-311A]